ncbi:polysaccharide biosynthesis/export family protein [Endothiovibrio diazotrophicus]
MKAPVALILPVLLIWVALFCAASGAAEDPSVYRLGNGDKIRVTVFGEKDLSGTFMVDGKGMVAMPLIGEVALGGLTLREAERRVADKLLDGFLKKPQVGIEVLNFRPFYILGEVKKPGSYPYVDGMTVLNAVALAGGFTYRAKKDHVVITRADDPENREQEVDPGARVFPGDMIRIKERFF